MQCAASRESAAQISQINSVGAGVGGYVRQAGLVDLVNKQVSSSSIVKHFHSSHGFIVVGHGASSHRSSGSVGISWSRLKCTATRISNVTIKITNKLDATQKSHVLYVFSGCFLSKRRNSLRRVRVVSARGGIVQRFTLQHRGTIVV